MEWIRSVARECKVGGMIVFIVAMVWTAGYCVQVDEQARRLDFTTPLMSEQDHLAAVEAAEIEEFLSTQ